MCIRDRRIDHAHAHAVQAAAEGVVFIVEFAAGMQAGQDELNTGDFFFGMNIHRHAAAVIADLATAVGIQRDACLLYTSRCV